jgi:hypothetical protein
VDHNVKQKLASGLGDAISSQARLWLAADEIAQLLDRDVDVVRSAIEQFSVGNNPNGEDISESDLELFLKEFIGKAPGVTLENWSDLLCTDCNEPATHAKIHLEDAATHDDVVILVAYCEEHFADNVLSFRWLQKPRRQSGLPDDVRDRSSDGDAGRPGSREGGA